MSRYLPETNAVHAGREDLVELGVHALPIDLSTTYPTPDLPAATASIDELARGGHPLGNPIYARLHNPTVARFEGALAELEGAEEAVAFGSGMAALTACLIAARQRGGHVVALRPLYGGSDHLLASRLLGLDVTWTDADRVGEALRPDTTLLILETPANPTLNLVDIEEVVRRAGEVPVLVDSTFATPVLQRPLRHGAKIVLHSATKFLGGHGDVIGGVVATDDATARELRQIRVATGALLHPMAAYLLHRGLQTLPVRIRQAQETAAKLAERLLDHPRVAQVLYPGLHDEADRTVLRRQMRGSGTMIAFEVAGGYEPARELMRFLRLITPAVSLGSTDTLIQHPAGLTHRVVDPEARDRAGISEGLLRISVGLEHVDDLWEDLVRAFDALPTVREMERELTSR